MKVKSNRVKEKLKLESFSTILHRYAYFETITIVGIYLLVGYFINPDDICILDGEISYILILLAIITLFHGFENGMLTLAILALAIWLTYPFFQYVEFLVALMMTMIFSEFHYYWTHKIKDAEINADYRGTKLDELSKAFYSLKISHDQLEKNYVIKPMSIRHSIEYIITKHADIDDTQEIEDKKQAYYKNFLLLLEKSFNVSSAAIIYKIDDDSPAYLDENNSNIVMNSKTEAIDRDMLFGDHLVAKSIERGTAIYISDIFGEPSASIDRKSPYLASIPALRKGKATAILVVKKMPFMSFNREVLTSISILLEYFMVEIHKKDILCVKEELQIIKDETFRFEYYRLKNIYNNYKVDSVNLVLRIDNELQSIRIYEKIEKMLRSWDLVAMVKENGFYYITLLFPLHDKAAALGYLNRLLNSLNDEKDKNFDYMTFNLSQTKLLNKYLSEDYSD